MSFYAIAAVFCSTIGSPTEKWVLLTIASHADPETGACWPSQQIVAQETELSERAVRASLAALEAKGFITRTKRQSKSGRSSDMIVLAEAIRRVVPVGQVGQPAGRAATNRQQVPEPNRQDVPGNLSIDESINETVKERLSCDWPLDYREQFWKLYPRKLGKAGAMRKLEVLKKSGKVPWAAFVASIMGYARAMEQSDPQYVKHPETWLNKGCWDDDPGAVSNNNGHYRRKNNGRSLMDAIDDFQKQLGTNGVDYQPSENPIFRLPER